MGLRIHGNTSRELKYKDIDSAEPSATFLEIFFHELIKSLAHRTLIQILTYFFLVAESREQHVRGERSPRHITSELGEQGKCSLPIRREVCDKENIMIRHTSEWVAEANWTSGAAPDVACFICC